MSKLDELMEQSPSLAVLDSFIITNNKLKNPCYKNISASISGGSDSDIVLDILTKLDVDKKVRYVWFDTGLEYQATKDHLKYLEEKYGVEIEIMKAIKPIPLTCKQHGQPFLNKFVSEQIERLQRHDFKWEDKPYEVLAKEYPQVKSAIKWWCNHYTVINNFKRVSRFDIGYNKWLKEFMVANPPSFKISSKCCKYAKKNVAKRLLKEYDIDCEIIGVRQGEGGIRSIAYKNCFTSGVDKGVADNYRPIFWYTNADKRAYEETFNITHSKCYTEYGMTRTGCAGCPFNRNFEEDLNTIETYEPKLYKAVNNIFGDSYEYTRKYREFVKQMKAKESGQLSLFEEGADE